MEPGVSRTSPSLRPRPVPLIGLALMTLVGCNGIYDPVEPDPTVGRLRQRIVDRVDHPLYRLELLTQLAFVERQMDRRGRQITKLQQHLERLQKRADALARYEATRIEIHGLTGFVEAIATERAPALEVHVRTINGYDHQTRVDGALDFWVVQRSGRWLFRREKTVGHWTRRAHAERRADDQQVFSHYVFRLPSQPDLKPRPGLVLKVKLVCDTGAVLETEYSLSPKEPSP